MKFLGKRRLIFGAVTVMVLGIVSLGYAAWTSSGGGTGFAKAASAQNLTTASLTGTTTATLYPGATGDLVVNVTNPNSYPIKVTSVTGNGTIAADSSHSTCGQDAQHPTGSPSGHHWHGDLARLHPPAAAYPSAANDRLVSLAV